MSLFIFFNLVLMMFFNLNKIFLPKKNNLFLFRKKIINQAVSFIFIAIYVYKKIFKWNYWHLIKVKTN